MRRMRSIRKISLFIIMLLVATLGNAQSKLSNYSRIYLNQNYNSDRVRTREVVVNRDTIIEQEEIVDAFVHFANNTDSAKYQRVSILAQYSAKLQTEFSTFVTAQIPIDQIEPLSNDERVSYIEIGEPVTPQLNTARPITGVDKVQEGIGLPQPFLGTGVLVGIIDLDMQYDHITFYDAENRDELRVKYVYDANTDRIYNTQSEIEALHSDHESTQSSHGTHVAGIAAGAYKDEGYYGVATDAELLMTYRLDMSNEATFVNIFAKYCTIAQHENKPIVVNFSIGTHAGPHDGTSTFCRAIDELTGEGKIFCAAAGNEGSKKIYNETLLHENDSVIWTLTFNNELTKNAFIIDMWSEVEQGFTVQLAILNSNDSILWHSQEIDAMVSDYLEFTNVNRKAQTFGIPIIMTSEKGINNKGNIKIVINSFTLFPNITNQLGLIIKARDSGIVRGWVDPRDNIVEWNTGNSTHTISELSLSNNTISVGSFNTQIDDYYTKEGELFSYSSTGPTADGRIKPDITAPGGLISSISDRTINIDPNTEYSEVNGRKYYWNYLSGTSMATPFVTGVIATWLQANPKLTPQEIKDIFAKTATRDEFTGQVPNNSWGYGKINAHAGLLEVLKTTGVEYLEEMPFTITLNTELNSHNIQVFFSKPDNDVRLLVYNMAGQMVKSLYKSSVTARDVVQMELEGLETGIYMMEVKGATHSNVVKIAITN